MQKKIKSFKEVCKICKEFKKKEKKIVFCHGFFDILHSGHVTLLVAAKKHGDILVVGVGHDDNARLFKGPKRPINDHDSRMFMLANLECVDYVFLIESLKTRFSEKEEFYGKDLYTGLKPDIIATCVKAGKYGSLKRKHAQEAGIKFLDVDRGFYDKSTTKIIELLGLD
jgi:rfaE bifunctional protein nucleotidyltransferase chain/domain